MLTSGVAAGSGVLLAGFWKQSITSFMGWSALVVAVASIGLMWVATIRFDQESRILKHV